MRRYQPVFATEADLCSAVIVRLREWGWTVYPESCGFDFVAVRDHIQVGVEAKLRPNLRVLSQALDRFERRLRVPHCIATLVERWSGDFDRIAKRIGLTSLSWSSHFRDADPRRFETELWEGQRRFETACGSEVGTLRLPDLVIDVPAGVPSPQTASAWKVRAVKMALRLRSGEQITRSDLDSEELAYSTFWVRGWIERANPGERKARYRIGSVPTGPLPDILYPEIVEALNRQEGAA